MSRGISPTIGIRVLLVAALLLAATPARARDLAQVINPDQCGDNNYCATCVADATTGGMKCIACQGVPPSSPGALVNLGFTGTVDGKKKCGCRPGHYLVTGPSPYCLACEADYYCPGGVDLTRHQCPGNGNSMGTNGKTGATKIASCLEKPGYYYVPPTTSATSQPSAEPCTGNTWSPGYKRLLKCRSCTAGFIMDPRIVTALRTSPDQCVVPPGSYLNKAGVAVKCPRGEYQPNYGTTSAPVTACVPCPKGSTTTMLKGATTKEDCDASIAGFAVTRVTGHNYFGETSTLCPQKSYCPQLTHANLVATTSETPCPGGQWTQTAGAKDASECLVPPGHFWDGDSVEPCPANNYRSYWLPASDARALSCLPCGQGISVDTEQMPLTIYNTDGTVAGFEKVAGSPAACYIEPGWGMLRKTDSSDSFFAVKCDKNGQYGAPDRQHGLATSPCLLCPTGMLTDLTKLVNEQNTGGTAYTSPEACVNKAGWGYSNRRSEPCPDDTYNAGNNQDACTPCGFGRTTNARTGQTTCAYAAGFDFGNAQAPFPCAKGTYHNGGATPTACTACIQNRAGTTTSLDSGATQASDCDVCLPGYGITAVGATSCTICGAGFFALGTDLEMCKSCPSKTVFKFEGLNLLPADYTYEATTLSSSSGATSQSDCVAAYAQLANLGVLSSDNSHHHGDVVPGVLGVTVDVPPVPVYATTLAQCITACNTPRDVDGTLISDRPCQWLNFDYAATPALACTLRLAIAPTPLIDPYWVLAFKQVPAGDMGSSVVALSKANGDGTKAKSFGSGFYTRYDDLYGDLVKDAATALTVTGTEAEIETACTTACTEDVDCAAVRFSFDADGVLIGTCQLIKPPVPGSGVSGAPTPYSNVRTLIRADIDSRLVIRIVHP